jgi:hypothetical protein
MPGAISVAGATRRGLFFVCLRRATRAKNMTEKMNAGDAP